MKRRKPQSAKPITRREFFSSLPRQAFSLFRSVKHSIDEIGSSLDWEKEVNAMPFRQAIIQFQREYFQEVRKQKIDMEEARRNYYYLFHRPARRLLRWLVRQKKETETDAPIEIKNEAKSPS
ncbi:hypothetical protein ACFL96_09630 [Thermoproteota archaeon]